MPMISASVETSFEIDQRLDADPADALGLLDMGDAGDDRAEDDRHDRHLDQLDEGAAEEVDPVVLGDIGASQPSSTPSTIAISTCT